MCLLAQESSAWKTGRSFLPNGVNEYSDAHKHVREHLPFDKAVSLRLPQLLIKRFLRNPGNLGARVRFVVADDAVAVKRQFLSTPGRLALPKRMRAVVGYE
jgi:hypothetical protein